ncbi:MAG: TOBE domain-containing protein [Zoogloeaceae bacterium]|nr:TOBE domain-containing protein [Zoogloeaceae bacterium]MCP5256103.1 TOBE domain-containing protein [Zoogloeaceae bacterium]
MHHDFDATMIYVTHDQVEAMTMADKIVVLQGGVIEQVGTPLDLYHHPVNKFVAGFMGSPNMNFLETTIEQVEAESVTVGLPGGGTVSVPVKGGKAKVGDKATLGVRPEHLIEGGGGDGEVSGTVLVVERLGGGTLIYARLTDDQTISAQIDGDSAIKVDDTIKLGIRNETCHVFTADGLALPQIDRHPLADVGRGVPAAH